MNVNNVLTKNYEKRTLGQVEKTNPIQTQYKPNQSQLKPIKSQNKPNSNPNKANFCTIGSAFCLQLSLSAENLLRNFAYGYQ
jgi:hypothetical protein